MNEKLFTRDGGDDPVRAIAFTIMPPLRCSYVEETPDRNFCGAHARYMRAPSPDEGSRFVCAAHRGTNDVPIAGELAIRVVTLNVEVLFAGVVPSPRIALLEALMRLNQAVEGVGGLVNLHGATSQLGRWTPPQAPDEENGDSGVPR